MHIEAYSRGKIFTAPDENEDAFVLIPNRLYAIIDGATDRLGTRYNGMYAGRFASQLVKQTLEEEFFKNNQNLPSFPALLQSINVKFRKAYQDHGILEKAANNATYRFTATLALIEQNAQHLDMILIGDSGIRINGTDVYYESKDLDHITALLRQAGWQHLENSSLSDIDREHYSKRLCFQGLDFLSENDKEIFNTDTITAIRKTAFFRAKKDLPHVGDDLILHLLDNGIIHGQHVYQNSDATCLGYAAIDGFDIPPSLIRTHQLKLEDIHQIELFSDGYFDPPAEFGIAAWEKSHRNVEQMDPAKVIHWLGPKGSLPNQWTDERTYLGIERK